MAGMTKEQIIAQILRTGDIGNVGTAGVAAAVKAASGYGVRKA
jgi:hypothetical protein